MISSVGKTEELKHSGAAKTSKDEVLSGAVLKSKVTIFQLHHKWSSPSLSHL